MVKANDIGNACLAIAAGACAYGAATNQPIVAAVALPLGIALKAVGSYITDHYQTVTEAKPTA
jgi:hypothetical protein